MHKEHNFPLVATEKKNQESFWEKEIVEKIIFLHYAADRLKIINIDENFFSLKTAEPFYCVILKSTRRIRANRSEFCLIGLTKHGVVRFHVCDETDNVAIPKLTFSHRFMNCRYIMLAEDLFIVSSSSEDGSV